MRRPALSQISNLRRSLSYEETSTRVSGLWNFKRKTAVALDCRFLPRGEASRGNTPEAIIYQRRIEFGAIRLQLIGNDNMFRTAVFQASHGQGLATMRSEYPTIDAMSEEREKIVRPGIDFRTGMWKWKGNRRKQK